MYITIAFLYFMQCICSSKFHKRTELCKSNSKISMISFFYCVFYAAIRN